MQGQISVEQKLQILNALADFVLLDRDITFQSRYSFKLLMTIYFFLTILLRLLEC